MGSFQFSGSQTAFRSIFGVTDGYLKAGTSLLKIVLRRISTLAFRSEQKFYIQFLNPKGSQKLVKQSLLVQKVP
jgi:hypothetical protein